MKTTIQLFNFTPIDNEGEYEVYIGKWQIFVDYHSLESKGMEECSVFMCYNNDDTYSKLMQHSGCVNHAINYVNKIISLY
jgi:hypothetical protein